MSTVRAAVREAMHLLKALAPGDDPTADELADGLRGAQELILEIHEGRGAMRNVDIPGPRWPGREPCPTPAPAPTSFTICPGENERLRIQQGHTVTVELPNSVSMRGMRDPFDYGFCPGERGEYVPQVGSLGAADGIYWRPPSDGARIEIVGTRQGLFFYRADTNAWMAATGLTLDCEQPLNERLQPSFAALLGERLADVLGNLPELTPAQKARISKAHELMFSRPGTRRPPVRAEYF